MKLKLTRYLFGLMSLTLVMFEFSFAHEKSIFQNLPVELVEEIYTYLGGHDEDADPTVQIIRLSHASHRLREIAKTIASRDDFEVSFYGKKLSERDFHAYFGKGGIFENAQNLSLSHAQFNSKLLAFLPHSLRLFSAMDANLKDEGVKIISTNLHSLQELSVDGNKIGDKGAMAIAENLRSLTRLHIRNNKIGPQGAKSISNHLTLLADLDISQNKLGDSGAGAVASGNLKALTRLLIYDNQMGDAGAEAIAEGIKNGSLSSVRYLTIKSRNVLMTDRVLGVLAGLKLLTLY